jgi:hypothetical protein
MPRSMRSLSIVLQPPSRAREESDDYTVIAERVLEAVRGWLEKHESALAY